MTTTSCTDITELLTPFIDGELAVGERHHVERHLAACVACRSRAEAERASRDLLRARRPGLARTSAPAGLRARLAEAARATPARGQGLPARIGRAPLAAAATLVLVAGGWSLHVATERSNTLLAAQLAADHTKCHLFHRESGEISPAEVRGRLRTRYGFDARVPAATADHRLELVGARRCLTGEGLNAHILYSYAGQPVSLYLVPDGRHPEGIVDVAGQRAALWSRHNGTYVLVADGATAELGRLASYMQQATE